MKSKLRRRSYDIAVSDRTGLRKEDRFSHARQVPYMIYEYFRVTGNHESILDLIDLMGVSMRRD